ncbi:MAG TPA: xanthine dehydrogenase family protein molybdopterin-binding subunit [Beijerinckiaceae bacterium]|jgi:carbon-monoxide dehydrogenase large subunit
MTRIAIGDPIGRFEDLRLVRGGGRYVDDIVLPSMLFGFVLRSHHAHAAIRSIDTRAARAAPGVRAVLTGEDWERSGFGDLPVPGGFKRRDGSPMYRPRFPALVKDRVRWVGDYVAFVVADTYHQAADAAELIAVDYEPLPAVTATAEALKPGAPLVWDDCPNNICFTHLDGDKARVDAAFAAADHVVRHSFVINRVTAATMEPRGCVGDYNAVEDRYTIYTTLQRAHNFRTELAANVLKMPEHKVRVVAGDIGGSFGMKSPVYNEVALVLLASKLTGRPVKWTSTRSEAFLSDAQGRDNVTEVELALDKDGLFLAMRVKNIVNLGAYLQTGGQSSAVGNLGTLAGVYRTPAIHVDVTTVFSHTNPMRPYRGNGRPEAAFVIERIVDLAADRLGIDRVEIRRRNLIPPEAMPFKTGLVFTYDCGEFEKNMDLALALSDYAGFEARRAEARRRGKLRGIGLSNSIERAAVGFEGAEIRFDRAGTVTVLSGAVTQGQGHETVFKQLVCERLGLEPDDVSYVQGDTEKVFFGEGTGGSRTATIGGSALHLASEKIIDKGKRIAAHLLGVDAGSVAFADGLFSTPTSNRTLSMKEVARAAANPATLPSDMEAGLVATAVYNANVENFPNGCHVCELEIDEETGHVEIVRYSVIDDVGTVLNPLLLKGQIQGGVAQGVGQMLMEDIRFEADSGQLLTASFLDYAMPRADNFSAIEVKSNPVPTATNPLGVKGAGEAGCVGALPAVASALADALSPLGIRHVEMPATPQSLWRLISAAKADGKAA